jgi:glycine cleavage system pyridoxal-binding protein P
MSNYTPTMIAQMQSAGSFTYDSASAFAEAHGLSVRSVISKVKHLGLDYTPKPKTVSTAGPRVAKSDIVNAIAKALDTDADMIAGLAKADARALSALLMAIR